MSDTDFDAEGDDPVNDDPENEDAADDDFEDDDYRDDFEDDDFDEDDDINTIEVPTARNVLEFLVKSVVENPGPCPLRWPKGTWAGSSAAGAEWPTPFARWCGLRPAKTAVPSTLNSSTDRRACPLGLWCVST